MKTKTAKATTSKKPSTKTAGSKKAAGKSEQTPAEVVEEVETPAPLEIPVEDEQLAINTKGPKTAGRNKDQYKLDGQLYGKGRIVQAVVRKYVADHPKVTTKQLKEVFPDELLNRFGIFQDENTANTLSGARPRYFMKDEDGIKLGDKKIVYTSSQFTSSNVIPLLDVAKKLGMKIATVSK